MFIHVTTQVTIFHIYAHGYLVIYTILHYTNHILGISSGENHKIAKYLSNMNMYRD